MGIETGIKMLDELVAIDMSVEPRLAAPCNGVFPFLSGVFGLIPVRKSLAYAPRYHSGYQRYWWSNLIAVGGKEWLYKSG